MNLNDLSIKKHLLDNRFRYYISIQKLEFLG